jgi:hypothetical protein
MPSDIIHDTLDTLITLLRETGARASPTLRLEVEKLALECRGEAEKRVRSSWGGEKVYIGKTHSLGIQAASARNKEILLRWNRGEHISFLCRHFGLSERRIQEILQQHRADQPANAPGAAVCLIDRAERRQDMPDANREPAEPPVRRRQPRAAVRAA